MTGALAAPDALPLPLTRSLSSRPATVDCAPDSAPPTAAPRTPVPVDAALVRRYRHLVYRVASAHIGRGLELEDLMQEGMCGLVLAARRYDPDRGLAFSTYARVWVQSAICKALTDTTGPVHLPDYVRRVLRRLTTQVQRRPTAAELAHVLPLGRTVCAQILHALDHPMPLEVESPELDRDQEIIGEVLVDGGAANPEEIVPFALLMDAVRTLFDGLTKLERMVVAAHLGFADHPQTFREIASQYGLTAEWSRRVYARAIKKLRTGAVQQQLDFDT